MSPIHRLGHLAFSFMAMTGILLAGWGIITAPEEIIPSTAVIHEVAATPHWDNKYISYEVVWN